MSRHNDNSSDVQRWSTPKLLRELHKSANLKTFSVGFNSIAAVYKEGWHNQANADQMPVEEFCREQTRLYRDTWMNPLIAVLAHRLGVDWDEITKDPEPSL